MSENISQSDREFLSQLQRSGPQRINELCETLGVTATAVRHRLNRLQNDGLVTRRTVAAERGRPYHTYRVTTEGQRVLGDDYSTLARLLWREVAHLQDEDARESVLAGLRRAMVARYQPSQPAVSVHQRFEQLRESLNREGFEVETAQRSTEGQLLPILREHSCPYHEVAAEDRSICEFEQSVFEEILGTAVTLAQCCHDGHSCCEFELATSS